MTQTRLLDLLSVGFMDRLDARDKAVLVRRALIKSCEVEPSPLDPGGWWYAVPGATYEGGFAALDLHDRFPVTLDEGADVERLPWRREDCPSSSLPNWTAGG